MATWVLDMDGVLWRGPRVVPGAGSAVAALLAAGHSVVCCTNHAHSPERKRAALGRLGLPDCPVVTSAESAASRCRRGERVLVLGDESLVDALGSVGLEAIDVFSLPEGSPAPEVEAVVVGASSRWDRSKAGLVADAVRSGARFLATNDDPTFPTVDAHGPRLLPGNGAMVAAVATAAGMCAEVTGKPHSPMVELIMRRHGPVDVVVGDRADTDGVLAERLGARFALVLSGVTTDADLPVSPIPGLIADDLAGVVRSLGGAASAT